MSLLKFDMQGSLFESLGSIAPDLFDDDDIYKLFARKIWPVLARNIHVFRDRTLSYGAACISSISVLTSLAAGSARASGAPWPAHCAP